MLYFCGNQIQTENTFFGHRVRNLSKTSFKSKDSVKSFHCSFSMWMTLKRHVDIFCCCWSAFVCLQNVSTCSHHIMPHIHRSLTIWGIIWGRMLNLFMPTYLSTKLMKKTRYIFFGRESFLPWPNEESHCWNTLCTLFWWFSANDHGYARFTMPCCRDLFVCFPRKKQVLYWSLTCQNPSSKRTVLFHSLVFSNSIGVFTRFLDRFEGEVKSSSNITTFFINHFNLIWWDSIEIEIWF